MKQKALNIKDVLAASVVMLATLFFSLPLHSQEPDNAEMKYVVVWDNEGGCISFPLEEKPRFDYDLPSSLVNCITTKQKISIPFREIHKYTLDVNPGIPSSVDNAFNEQGEIKRIAGLINLRNFKPGTEVFVCTVDGVVTARYNTDAAGSLDIDTGKWQQGLYIINVNKVLYKVYKK